MSVVRRDVPSLHRRLALIIATQIRHLRKKQIEKNGLLSFDDVRQFKLIADALDNQIKIQRLLKADMKKELEKLPDEQLEAIAATPPHPPTTAAKPAPKLPASADKTKTKRPKATKV